ncbi:MAG: hypothetical protein H7843_13840 [Nitrospirota bacterium]
MKDRYSCSVTKDICILFKLSSDVIHLVNIGTHDEVY